MERWKILKLGRELQVGAQHDLVDFGAYSIYRWKTNSVRVMRHGDLAEISEKCYDFDENGWGGGDRPCEFAEKV